MFLSSVDCVRTKKQWLFGSVCALTVTRHEDSRSWVIVICFVCQSDRPLSVPVYHHLLLPVKYTYHGTRLALWREAGGVKQHYMKLWKLWCSSLPSLLYCAINTKHISNWKESKFDWAWLSHLLWEGQIWVLSATKTMFNLISGDLTALWVSWAVLSSLEDAVLIVWQVVPIASMVIAMGGYQSINMWQESSANIMPTWSLTQVFLLSH